MKSFIPNFFTLANLFLGTIGIVVVLGMPPENHFGVCPMTIGALCICLGCVCDFFDGFFARLLGSISKIGKDLDSLADLVAFGLLPSFILLQSLNQALDQITRDSVLVKLPLGVVPMLMPCFTAYRLARFNSIQKGDEVCFVGLSSTACGMLIAAITLALKFSNYLWLKNFFMLHETILIVAVSLSLLMVSRVKFLSYKFSSFSWRGNELRYITIGLYLCSAILLKVDGVLLAFIIYLLTPIGFLFTKPKGKLEDQA